VTLSPKPIDRKQNGQRLPGWIVACTPTLVDKPPSGPGWVHEIKWDGYRISAYVEGGKATIRTSRGHDWTARFPTIAAAVSTLKVRSAVIDGEAVILDAKGKSSFAELQAAPDRHRSDAVLMYAFDILFLDGEDIRHKPLEARRKALVPIIKSNPFILLSQQHAGDALDFFNVACKHELEGIVSKRLDSAYRSGKSKSWLKTKCVQSDVFVVIGYQQSSGSIRAPLADLKLAQFDGATLHYVGTVGTGFSDAVAAALRQRLDRIITSKSAVSGLKMKGAVWTTPDLMVQIAYRGMTATGELRHASFKGIVE
jgi:bifunctional non-homologous end joining protein LigD